MRHNASVSPLDRQADADNETLRRLRSAEGVAHVHPLGAYSNAGVVSGTPRTVYGLVGDDVAYTGTAVGFNTSGPFGIVSVAEAALVGDLFHLDAVLRIGGSAGATGAVRISLSVTKPDTTVSLLFFTDHYPPAAANSTSVDTLTAVPFPPYSALADGTHTFLVTCQQIGGGGSWQVSAGATMLRCQHFGIMH